MWGWIVVALGVAVGVYYARAPPKELPATQKKKKPLKNAAAAQKAPSAPEARLPAWLNHSGMVIFDANNVRGALGFEYDSVELCALLTRLSRKCPARIVNCMDHGPHACALQVGDIVVSFSGHKTGPYTTADDMIVSDAGRAAKKGCAPVIVITSDRELTKRLKFACLRFPQCRLVVVSSAVFADYCDTSHLAADVADASPFSSPFDVKVAQAEDEWLAGLSVQKRKGKAKAKKLVRNVSEGTPSRCRQADGLYDRLVKWAGRQPAGAETVPAWLQDYLDRHPWAGA
ncbi:hypothetical protein M885DRAFT_512573 [Pelagophyceae sp. CCMP2097]|nr:hypothetical protein M885DRAFT_512573 [Pelagophyceae sp. CCMP2097]